MKLEFATQEICGPTGAVKIDPKKDINYFETLSLFCADNDIDLSEVSDLEFEAMATELSHFGLGFDGPLEPFWFWVEA
jgi:hypothetical protein